jgi:diguanylate cyclase (GGDEF)-like protein/PAS domain S-box-containing protein
MPNPTRGQAASSSADTDLLQSVLEHASDLSLLLDRDLRITWISPEMPAQWEYVADGVIGTAARDVVHPDDLELFDATVDRLLAVPGAHDRCETRLREGGDRWRWVELRLTNLLDDDAVAAVVVTTTDVSERRRAQQALGERDRFYQAVFAGATDAAVVCDSDTTIRWISPSVSAVCGFDRDAMRGTRLGDLVHPEDRLLFEQFVERIRRRPGGHDRLETRVRHPLGDWRWSEHRVTNLLHDADVEGLVFNSVDITSRRVVQEDLQTREQFLRVVLESAHEGVWVLDPNGRTVFANRRIAEMLRTPLDMLLNHPLDDVLDSAAAAEVRQHLTRARAGAEAYELLLRPQGRSELWVSVSVAPLPAGFSKAILDGGVVALLSDISDRKAYEDALRQQSLYDPLTGLPNRALLEVHLKAAEERFASEGEHFAYLLCDIDGLKLINDGLGGVHGDAVIREIGQRLVDAARPGDCVARTTGDQFVVIAANAESHQAGQVARDLAAAVQGPFELAGSAVWPSISVGAASTSDVPPYGLPSAADAALQRAKGHDRGSALLFNAAAPRDHRARLEMLADLRDAVTTGALEMRYQPLVRLSTNEVVGAEALMRWNRPGHGDVPPSVFIPLAEEAGLLPQLGAWALRQACRDAADWPDRRHVGVNLSAHQLVDDLIDTVRDALETSGLPPAQLWLEVTETAVFADTEAAGARLRSIADLGVRISLDDFGTGFSSMAYLRDFPVHALKIDRSFVAGLDKNADDTAIVATLVSLGAGLELQVIAEGIETTDQVHSLRRRGCEYGQGFLWRPALSPEQFVEAIAEIERDVGPVSTPRTTRWRTPADPTAVARILSMHRQGASPATIASALNLEAVPAPNGKQWHRVSVAHVIASNQTGPSR